MTCMVLKYEIFDCQRRRIYVHMARRLLDERKTVIRLDNLNDKSKIEIEEKISRIVKWYKKRKTI